MVIQFRGLILKKRFSLHWVPIRLPGLAKTHATPDTETNSIKPLDRYSYVFNK
jgi:hypothetical protein